MDAVRRQGRALPATGVNGRRGGGVEKGPNQPSTSAS